MRCEDCGATTGRIINSRKFKRHLCMKCYQIRSYHPDMEFHELPPKGEINLDSKGRPICHICGRSADKLMSHVRLKHDMSARDYKIEFGLNVGTGIMSEKSKEVARQKNLENREIVVDKNLIERGGKTRFSKGQIGRTREKLSLQELNRIRRMNRGRGV